MAYKLYFEDVNVGDTLPSWSRQTDFMSWNRYAAVGSRSWLWNPIPMQEARKFARSWKSMEKEKTSG